MQRKAKLAVSAIALAALVLGGATAAGAAGGEGERSITGRALEEASKEALEATGGGSVTDTEVGDEDGYYEVEVTKDDGSQTDVHLDRDFNVLGLKADGD